MEDKEVLREERIRELAQMICRQLRLPERGGAYVLLRPIIRDIVAEVVRALKAKEGEG